MDYTQEELRKRAQDRVQECKDTIPGYRESILEKMIEREMFLEALSYNGNLDYQERVRQFKAQQKEEHVTFEKCLCSKIKELFK